MPYYIFAWIASFLYAIVAIVSKLVSKHSIKNPYLFNILWTAATLVFTLVVGAYFGFGLPKVWSTMIWTGVFVAIASTCFFLALERMDISALAPLYNLRSPFTVILAWLIIGEILSGQQSLWLIIIVIAGFWVTYDEHLQLKAFFTTGVLIAIFAIFFSSLISVFLNKAISESGYWEATIWPLVIDQIILLGTFPLFRKELKRARLRPLVTVAGVAAVEVLGMLAMNKALATNVGITVTIVNLPLSMVITVAIARLAPRLLESHPMKVYIVRLVAVGVMVAAATQLPR